MGEGVLLGDLSIPPPSPLLLGSAQLAFVLGSRARRWGQTLGGGVMIPSGLGVELSVTRVRLSPGEHTYNINILICLEILFFNF